jgi:hypothetical protein
MGELGCNPKNQAFSHASFKSCSAKELTGGADGRCRTNVDVAHCAANSHEHH